MKKLSEINENIFLDRIGHNEIYKRKEDDIRIKDFIDSRENPGNYYTTDNGLTVNCKKCVTIHDKDLVDGKLPVKFGKVNGDFSLYACTDLVSLEGCPEEVGGWFDCSECHKLVSLEGAPRIVRGDFDCNDCDSLKSLKGMPQTIEGHFSCHNSGDFTVDDIPADCSIENNGDEEYGFFNDPFD